MRIQCDGAAGPRNTKENAQSILSCAPWIPNTKNESRLCWKAWQNKPTEIFASVFTESVKSCVLHFLEHNSNYSASCRFSGFVGAHTYFMIVCASVHMHVWPLGSIKMCKVRWKVLTFVMRNNKLAHSLESGHRFYLSCMSYWRCIYSCAKTYLDGYNKWMNIIALVKLKVVLEYI